MSLTIAKIDVREPMDVAAAFNFSHETNTMLVVKNTGVHTNALFDFHKATVAQKTVPMFGHFVIFGL